MARSSVELIVDASKAINPLKRVTSETKKLESSVAKAQSGIRRTNQAFKETGRVADRASKGVSKLGKAVRGLVAGFGAFQAGKFVIFKTAELERQTKSLEVLTGSLGNARNIIKELQQFGAVTPFTSSELIETAKRLKAFGFETEQIVDVTKRLADVAGATGADLGGIATAFGQIQAKGRLQGEELLQLQERGIGLQDELVKMYGFTADEFRKALEGGRISADAVNVALQNITNTGGKYANGAIAQSETLSGKFSTLVDNITVLAQHIGDALSPALKEILGLTNQILAGFNDLLSSQVARGVAGAKLNMLTPGGSLGDIAQMRANVAAMPTTTLRDEASIQETARRLTDISNFVREFGTAIETRRPGGTSQQERNALEGLQGLIQDQLASLGKRQIQIAAEDKPTVIKSPDLLKRTNAGGKTAAEIEEERLKKIAEASADRVRSLKQQTLLAAALTEEERTQFERQIQIADILENKQGLTKTQLETELQATVALFEQQDATKALTEQQKNQADAKAKAQEEEKKRADELKSIYQGIGDTIADGVVNALKGAVDGTTSLADAATSLLNDLGNQMLQLARNMLFFGNITGSLVPGGGILGNLFSGFLANGGTAMGGRSYVVGEKGPELFTPGRTGSVAPTGSFGGANVVVNVDASGTQAQGDQPNAKALGSAIGVAVQAELIKQKRPGGLLA